MVLLRALHTIDKSMCIDQALICHISKEFMVSNIIMSILLDEDFVQDNLD